MAEGFRVADAWVGLTLDRDQLRADLAALPGELNAEADAAGEMLGEALGRSASDRLGEQIGDGVRDAPVEAPATEKGTRAGDRFGSSFSSKVRAALAALPPAEIELDDEYAQSKLTYLREELLGLGSATIGVDVSDTEAIARLTALRTDIDDLRAASPSVQVRVDTAVAAAEIDKFLAETELKASAAGKKAGADLSDGMASSSRMLSPLIVSAIAGGLIAGGPAISAASVLLFGGLSAVAASNVGEVQDSFRALRAYVLNDVQVMAQQSASEYVAMAGAIKAGFLQVEPAIRAAMAGAAVDVHDVADALVSAADTAVPAFTRAIQGGQPVVQGLDALVRDLGSGVAGMLDALTAHSGAEGQVLSELGQTIQILLPTVGELLGEGAELGRTVLPMLNGALGATADVLHIIGPALPAVVGGFAAFKAVSALTGPLGLLSAKLQTVAADSEGLTYKLAGVGAQGASGLANALPALGISLGVLTSAWTAQEQMVDSWSHALLEGGQAAAQATAEMDNSKRSIADAHSLSDAWNIVKAAFADGGAQLQGYSSAQDKAQQGAKDLRNAMSPLEQKQQAVTTATNDLQAAIAKYGPNSAEAAAKAGLLAAAQAAVTVQTRNQEIATSGLDQALVNAASATLTLMGAETNYQGAVLATTSAEQSYAQAVKQHGASSLQAQQSEVALQQSIESQGQALGQITGNQLPANATATQKADAANAGMLATLLNLQHTMGASFPASMAATISQLRGSVSEGELATAQFDALGLTVTGVPNSKTITVASTSPQVDAQLSALGFHVTHMPDGTVRVDAATKAAEDAINNVARNRTATVYVRSQDIGVTGRGTAGMAAGGVIRMYAGGGVEPMAAGVAQTVPPGTLRVIGDNPRSDESYIPIDGSPRSQDVLQYTADRMGYGLVPNADGGTTLSPSPIRTASASTARGDVVNNLSVHVHIPAGVAMITDRDIPATVTAALQQALIKLERASR